MNWLRPWNSFFKLNLKRMLFISGVFLGALFLLGQSVILYQTGRNDVQKRLDELEEQRMIQLVNNMNLGMEEMIRFTANLSEHVSLKSMIRQLSMTDGNTLEHRNTSLKIRNFLVSSATFYTHILRIDVITEHSAVSSSPYTVVVPKPILDSSAYSDLRDGNAKVEIVRPAQYDLSNDRELFDLAFVALIDYSANETPAMISIQMNRGWIGELLQSSRYVGLLDEDREPIWSNMDMSSDHSSFRMRTVPLGQLGWSLAVFTDLSETYRPLNEIRQHVWTALAISLSCSLLLSTLISRKVALPFSQLASDVKLKRIQSEAKGQKIGKGFKEILLLYYIVVVSLPLLVYGIVFFLTVSELMENTTKASYRANVEQTARNFDSFFNMNQRIGMNIASYYITQDWLKRPDSITESQKQELRYLLDQSTSYLGVPGEIFIYDLSGKSLIANVFNERQLAPERMHQLNNNRKNKKYWVSLGENRHGKKSVEYYFEVANLETLQPIGYIGIAYSEGSIRTIYRDIVTLNSTVELHNEEGIIFSSNQDHRIGEPEGGQYDRMFRIQESLLVDEWTLTAWYPESSIMEDSNRLLILNVLLLLASLLCIVLLSYHISALLARSVTRMEKSILNWEISKPLPDFRKGIRIAEIEQLGMKFNHMAEKIESLTRSIYEARLQDSESKRERKELEMQVLQAQINPHFLYNTLESVKWMILDDDKHEAVQAVENLGDLFRLGVSRKQDVVKIEEEIRYTMLYSAIQKMRFMDQLQIRWHVQDGVISCQTVKLVLQPIVENAIHHGMKGKNTLYIDIRIYGDDMNIYFEVEDNGRGIAEDEVAKINESLQTEANKGASGRHIGLKNVSRRLQLQYGDQYRLHISSQLHRGTTVRWMIPKEK